MRLVPSHGTDHLTPLLGAPKCAFSYEQQPGRGSAEADLAVGSRQRGSAEADLAVGARARLGAVDQLQALDGGAQQTGDERQAGFSERSSSRLCLASRPKSTVAAMS